MSGDEKRRLEAQRGYGKRLRQLRHRRLRLTQEALSEKTGISTARISEIENARTPHIVPRPDTHEALTRFFADKLNRPDGEDPDVAAFNAAYEEILRVFEGDDSDEERQILPPVVSDAAAPHTSELPPEASTPEAPDRLHLHAPLSLADISATPPPPAERVGDPANGTGSGEWAGDRRTSRVSFRREEGERPRRPRRRRPTTVRLLAAGLVLTFLLVSFLAWWGGIHVSPQWPFLATSTSAARRSLVPSQETPPHSVIIQGYLVAAEQRGTRSVVVVIDPHTGATRQLLPEEAGVIGDGQRQGQGQGYGQGLGPGDAASPLQSLIFPTYAPVRHALAYIGVTGAGMRSLWVAPLTQANGTVQVTAPGPHQLLADCGRYCNTLAWTPDGDWLIYDGPDGLEAISPETGEQRAVTRGTHDSWPACSPDGRWLAYQYAVEARGYIVLIASADCLPLPDAFQHAWVASGYIVAWRPTWSSDSHLLAFTSSSDGQRVYVADLAAFTSAGSDAGQPPIRALSGPGCGEAVWVAQAAEPRDLVAYVCRSQAVQRLEASPGDGLSTWQAMIGMPDVAQPALYNPTWIPPQ